MNSKTILNSLAAKIIIFILVINFVLTSFYQNGFYFDIEFFDTFYIESTFSNSLIYFSINILFLIAVIISWSRLITKYKLYEGSKKSVYLISVLGVAIFPDLVWRIDLVMTSFLIALLLNSFLGIYNQQNINKRVFWGAVSCGLSTLLFAPSFYFFIAFIVGISMIRPFNLKMYLVGFLGLLIPIFYAYSFGYVFEYKFTPLHILGANLIAIDLNQFNVNHWTTFVLLFFIGGFAYSLLKRAKLVVHTRNQISFIAILFVFSFLLFLLNDHGVFLILLFPASFFISNMYHQFQKKWVLDIVLILFLIMVPLGKHFF